MAVISVGWSCWLQGYPPSSTHSSSSNQLKSQPCIFREYVGMVFLVIGVAGVFGVAPLLNERKKQLKVVNMRPVGLGKHEGFRPINAPKSARTLQTDLHLIRRLQKPPLWATISSLSLSFWFASDSFLVSSPHTYLAASPPSIGDLPSSTVHCWCHHKHLVNSWATNQHSLHAFWSILQVLGFWVLGLSHNIPGSDRGVFEHNRLRS